MLKYKEVHTNFIFENIPTMPLELRACIEISTYYKSNIFEDSRRNPIPLNIILKPYPHKKIAYDIIIFLLFLVGIDYKQLNLGLDQFLRH